MASRIKAVSAYRLRIEQGNITQKPKLLRAVSRATSLVEVTVDQTIIEFCRSGRAGKVEGLGIFTSTMDLTGNIAISFHADPAFAYGLNVPGVLNGKILNRENIGKTSDQLVKMRNDLNPDNQVPFSEN